MKSRISLFDRGVSRSLLRRFWPLWTGYAVYMLLRLPARMPAMLAVAEAAKANEYDYYSILSLDGNVISNGVGMLLPAAIVSLILAGAMFGFLYNGRMCGLMNSLPLRRETMFCTAWLTGLLPLLLINLLCALLAGAIGMPSGKLSMQALLKWFAFVSLGELAFYNFAVFCGMLTGRKVYMPLIFLMLNFIVGLLVGCVMVFLMVLLYGYSGSSFPAWARFLTPGARLIQAYGVGLLSLFVGSGDGSVSLKLHAVYTGLSVLFLLAALFLYRRRQMETAGDAVAVPWAKPILKYLFCLGFTFCFTLLVAVLTQLGRSGTGEVLVYLLPPLLIGCFLGYFIAEMLQRRTVKVFRGHWRGFFITAAVLCVLVLACRFDVFGYETYVPAESDIAFVEFDGSYIGHLEQPEHVADAVALHREALTLKDKEALTLKDKKDSRESAGTMTLRYTLKNGRTVEREYSMTKAMRREVIRLCDDPEAILCRMREISEVPFDRIESVYISEVSGTGDNYRSASYALTEAQFAELMQNGVLPDAELGRIDLCNPDTFRGTVSYSIRISLKSGAFSFGRSAYTIKVDSNSEYTRLWIRTFLASAQAEAAKDV